MKVVTERLLHAERKQKDKASVDFGGEKAMTLKFKGRGPRCHYCKKMGHIQKKTVWSVSRPKERQNRMDLGSQK